MKLFALTVAAVLRILASCQAGPSSSGAMMKCSGCSVECKPGDLCGSDKMCARCDNCCNECSMSMTASGAKVCMKCGDCSKHCG